MWRERSYIFAKALTDQILMQHHRHFNTNGFDMRPGQPHLFGLMEGYSGDISLLADLIAEN
jgi:hypothetical protein